MSSDLYHTHQRGGNDGEGPRSPRKHGPRDVTDYRYWPVFDSVSIARLALAFLPVTRVRM